MRVTLVTAHYPPRLSGHADFSQRLAQSISSDDVDVTVVVLSASEGSDEAGFDVHYGPFPGSWRSLRAAVDAIAATTPDVVLLQFEAHAFELKTTPHLLPLALRRRGMRVVMTYHELWKPRRFGFAAKTLLLNSAHRVVTFSHWHAAGVNRFSRIGPAADIVACGSNITTPISLDRRLLRARYDIAADTVLFTFFGFVMAEHCVDEVLHAIAQLRREGLDARLQVIGKFDPTTDGYHQRLVRSVSELGLDGIVTWHGRVMAEADVARLLTISDVGVLPYDTGVGENNGAFAAYAHYQLATVTTRGERSGLMEQLEIAAFAEPTVSGLTDALRTLGRDTEYRVMIAKAAHEWSNRRSWSVAADAYRRVLSGDPEPLEVL